MGRVQNRLHGHVGDELFHALKHLSYWRNIANSSLIYRYFHSLFPPVNFFTANTRYVKYTILISFVLVRGKFYSDVFFLSAAVCEAGASPTTTPFQI